MKRIRTAIIPLAGRGTRLYPASTVMPKGLMPLIDKDGIAKAAIQLMAEECVKSDIERIILVIGPESGNAYQCYFRALTNEEMPFYAKAPLALEQSSWLAQLSQRIEFVVQNEPRGLGHAVFTAQSLVDGEPFVVLLGDHVYLTSASASCLKQTIQIAERRNASVYAVHPVHESLVHRFGILSGALVGEKTYKLQEIAEKPSLELARNALRVEGMPEDQFLAHFGIYVFTPEIMDILEDMSNSQKTGEIQLTEAQRQLLLTQSAYGYIPDGESFDFGVPEGLLETQTALGLKSPYANQIKCVLG